MVRVIEYFAKSLKLTHGQWKYANRNAIGDSIDRFLLAFHSNYGSVLYHFRDIKSDTNRKSRSYVLGFAALTQYCRQTYRQTSCHSIVIWCHG